MSRVVFDYRRAGIGREYSSEEKIAKVGTPELLVPADPLKRWRILSIIITINSNSDIGFIRFWEDSGGAVQVGNTIWLTGDYFCDDVFGYLTSDVNKPIYWTSDIEGEHQVTIVVKDEAQ